LPGVAASGIDLFDFPHSSRSRCDPGAGPVERPRAPVARVASAKGTDRERRSGS